MLFLTNQFINKSIGVTIKTPTQQNITIFTSSLNIMILIH